MGKQQSHFPIFGSNSHFKNWFFESQPMADFQKTNFGFSSACGAGKPKIGFVMRISAFLGFTTKQNMSYAQISVIKFAN